MNIKFILTTSIKVIGGLLAASAIVLAVFSGYRQSLLGVYVANAEGDIDLPANFPELNVEITGETLPGEIYIALTGEVGVQPRNYLLKLDSQTGEVTFAKRVSHSARHFTRFNDELDVHHNENWIVNTLYTNGLYRFGLRGLDGGHWVFMDENYNRVEAPFNVPGHHDLHEILELQNGNFLVILNQRDYEPLPAKDCEQNCLLITQDLVQVDPNGNIVHVYELDSFYDETDSPAIREMQAGYRGRVNVYDVTHINSAFEDPDGNIAISVRQFDEVANIDMTTGEVVWVLGGEKSPYNQFTILDDPQNGFSHQHHATILENGNVMVFDNGNLHDDQHSRAVEYELDFEEMTATLVWSYTPPEEFYTPTLGSTQRLPDGNTLINWAIRRPGTIEVVTADNDVIFSVDVPDDYRIFRASYFPHRE